MKLGKFAQKQWPGRSLSLRRRAVEVETQEAPFGGHNRWSMWSSNSLGLKTGCRIASSVIS